MTIEIDYALSMAAAIGGAGLSDTELAAERLAVERAVRRVSDEVAAGRLGFWNLPSDTGLCAKVKRAGEMLIHEVSDVLVLGIGGSSLGGRALCQALTGPSELPGPRKTPRLHFVDNSDPWMLAALLNTLDPKSMAVIAISKSGGTVETAAQLMILREHLRVGAGAAAMKSRLLVITDPSQGALRKLANDEGLPSLEVPPNVGGRFSALTAVGLLPAWIAGADIDGILRGALGMAERCARDVMSENPAAIIATVSCLHHRLRQRPLHVMMPYSDALRPFASWYVQLWAESLGKRVNRRGQVVETGPTPLAAIGATDQHAQVQLFMEGPRDKLITFVRVKQAKADLVVPKCEGDFAYLSGASLHSLLDAEREGTTQALAQDGRPSLTLTLDAVDAEHVGALVFLYEAATAIAGELYAIDAFDQPGVEEGKRLAFGLLGREGFAAAGEAVRSAITARPTNYRV